MMVSTLLVVLLFQGTSAQLRELFETLDQNNDGSLNRKEFRAFSQSTVGADGQPRDGFSQRQHFDSIDLDGDGLVGVDEFAASSSEVDAPHAQDPDAAAAATINHFDTDGDGQLSVSEMEALLSMSHGVDADSLDTNHDGYVSHEELRQSIQATMQAAVADAEFKHAHGARR